MTDNLASRMLVNIFGIPGILLLVYLGRFYFAIFVTVVCLLALREFYNLCRIKEISPQIPAGAAACLVIPFFYYRGLESTLLSLTWHQVLIVFILFSAIFELFRKREKPTENFSTTVAGILYIPVLLGALIGLRQIDAVDYAHGMRLTMTLFATVWICDSAAYAFGKKWGRRRIMEKVSPKKTVVGCTAGLVTAVLFCLLVWSLGFLGSPVSMASLSLVDAVMIGLIVGVFGQTGDFVESLIKRDVGVKDSSNFLPGHGGVLDRFDSLIIASPLTYLYLQLAVYP